MGGDTPCGQIRPARATLDYPSGGSAGVVSRKMPRATLCIFQ